MNKIDRLIAAIDIGTSKIVTIAGMMDHNGILKITGFYKSEFNKGDEDNSVRTEAIDYSLRTTVREVIKQTGCEIREAIVGFTDPHLKGFQGKGGILLDENQEYIEPCDADRLFEEMRRITAQPGEKILHMNPLSYIIDNESGIKYPYGMCGRRLEGVFCILTGSETTEEKLKSCMEMAGINAIEMIPGPLASGFVLLDDNQTEAGVALVDIGGDITSVAIYYDFTLRHAGVIPLGGNSITSDISKHFALPRNYAEWLKIRYGSAISELVPDNEVIQISYPQNEITEISIRELATVSGMRMKDLIEAVSLEIRKCGLEDKLAGGIVLTGGGAMLKHLQHLWRRQTSMDVRIGMPSEHFTDLGLWDINYPMYASSVGLLYGGNLKVNREASLW